MERERGREGGVTLGGGYLGGHTHLSPEVLAYTPVSISEVAQCSNNGHRWLGFVMCLDMQLP